MNPHPGTPRLAPIDPLKAAERLQLGLKQLGITGDVHDGFGFALVSVWVGLVVWSDGDRFWWRVAWNPARSCPIYTWHQADDWQRAAWRVARRYAELRGTQPLPETGEVSR
jgi:hypothetical protein